MDRLLTRLTPYKNIIWDWNGTLYNDVDCCHGVIAELMEYYQLTPISKTVYLEKFRFPVIDYYTDIGFDFSKISFAELALIWKELYLVKARGVTLYPYTRDLLENLKKQGIKSWILTAAYESDVKKLLVKHEIADFFEAVYGLDNHHAGSKLQRGEELLKEIGNVRRDVLLVGDTDHDWNVANALNIEALLLTAGHQSTARLELLSGEAVYSRVLS